MAWYAVKITEFAIGYTYIGGIYIPVYLPGNFAMWHLLFTLSSSATYINSVKAAFSNRYMPSSTDEKFKSAVLY